MDKIQGLKNHKMANLTSWLKAFGIDPRKFINASRGLPRYLKAGKCLRSEVPSGFIWSDSLPILDEWDATNGSLGAYFFQDQLVARWIYKAAPERHYDVGSRLDGFIGSLSVFREVDAIDLRKQPATVRNVNFHQLDLMEELPPEWTGIADSLSCLHTIEHFGLGRYGDSVDPLGHIKGLDQLKKLVAPGGIIYLSTPVGPQRIVYNAHRVFNISTLREWFADGWVIERSAIIDDECQIHEDVFHHDTAPYGYPDCNLGVGIIAARKSVR